MTNTTPDKALNPKLQDARAFDGVLTRRVFAFLIDYLFIGLLLIPVAIVVFLLGFLTFGLGWLLLPVLGVVVALPYVGFTLGGPNQATPGMRISGLRMEMLDGRQVDWLLAMVHTVLFWAFNAALTPLILLVSWFTDGKRTLHDVLLGVVLVRDDS